MKDRSSIVARAGASPHGPSHLKLPQKKAASCKVPQKSQMLRSRTRYLSFTIYLYTSMSIYTAKEATSPSSNHSHLNDGPVA